MTKAHAYVDKDGMVHELPHGPKLGSILTAIFMIVIIVAFSLLIADMLGYSPTRTVAPPPTPIIRVVAPQEPPQAPPAAQPPIEQPAPVAPALVAPRPAPAIEQPTPAPARQIIIVKNGSDPAAAPIVIDRGSKRRSP